MSTSEDSSVSRNNDPIALVLSEPDWQKFIVEQGREAIGSGAVSVNCLAGCETIAARSVTERAESHLKAS